MSITTPSRLRSGPELVVATLGSASGLRVELLANGAIGAIRAGDVLVSQVIGTPLEPGIGNVWLRERGRRGEAVAWWPLVGPVADKSSVVADRAEWVSVRDGLHASCSLRVDSERNVLAWAVRVRDLDRRSRSLDVVFAQDLGLGEEAAVRASELYTSHYIDHTVLRDEDLGYVLCSRQNLPQHGAHPWIAHACVGGSVGYLTDGFQFFGLAYRATNHPVALDAARLPNRVYQYELALPTLESRRQRLAPGATADFGFVAVYLPDHPSASAPDDLVRVREATRKYADQGTQNGAGEAGSGPNEPVRRRHDGVFTSPRLFPSEDLPLDEIDRQFGTERRLVEIRADAPQAFFFGERRHAVLRPKELVTERPAGHIVRSGHGLIPDDDILSATVWMDGVFASQLAIGNTSFNQLIGVWRNPLNVLKAGGLRILVGRDRKLLALPSSFDMGRADARWIYRDRDRTIVVTVEADGDEPMLRLEIVVDRGGPLELLVTNDVVLGGDGGPPPRVTVDEDRARIELKPAPDTPIGVSYPEAAFHVVTPDRASVLAIGGDELLEPSSGSGWGTPRLAILTRPVNRFSLVFTGSVVDSDAARERADRGARPVGPRSPANVTDYAPSGRAPRVAVDGQAGHRDSDAGLADIRIDPGDRASPAVRHELERLTEVLPWFVQNALIHYLTPHGLEQSAGAAWGVRDVCQGPTELFTALRRFEPVRAILRTVYAHQVESTGDWPQWFMFDRYHDVHAPDSHGDVIHWPLKAICDYVEATGDLTLLDDEVGYLDGDAGAEPRAEPIWSHVDRQLSRIEATFVPGTALVAFGHGDWEDTLQPADQAMAEHLVSPWTVELAYQTLVRFGEVCQRAERTSIAARLEALCARMRADFRRLLMPDGIVAGLARFESGRVEYLLHPGDRLTGVHYRLIPMTRGILSGLFTPAQARRHLSLIERHLSFPDGVRLMNRPLPYRGGTETLFRRAESAANFGREIGLQYVHAHLRYVEALTRVGRADEAVRGLLAVCPVGLEATVPSALPRQTNAYFSSSDGAFADRYEAARHFGRLRTGKVGVKGGWRVYSSGPGLFIRQLVSSVFGLRDWFGDVLLDPVVPGSWDGVECRVDYEGTPVRFRYHVAESGFGPAAIRVNGKPIEFGRMPNPYRTGGALIARGAFMDALGPGGNVVEIDV